MHPAAHHPATQNPSAGDFLRRGRWIGFLIAVRGGWISCAACGGWLSSAGSGLWRRETEAAAFPLLYAYDLLCLYAYHLCTLCLHFILYPTAAFCFCTLNLRSILVHPAAHHPATQNPSAGGFLRRGRWIGFLIAVRGGWISCAACGGWPSSAGSGSCRRGSGTSARGPGLRRRSEAGPGAW